MRGRKRSVVPLINQGELANPPEHHARCQQIHERLVACARGVLGAFLQFAEAVRQAKQAKVWEYYGYRDPEPYFIELVGIAPRTFRRYVRVENMLTLLPPDRREHALEKVAQIGPNKAEVIASAVERDPSSFDSWIEEAECKTREALEESVNRNLGLPARGGPTDGGEPGEKFLRYILNVVPPDRRDHVEKIFKQIMIVGETRNPIAAFLFIVGLAARDLASMGYPVE